jgi:hypothetical protein
MKRFTLNIGLLVFAFNGCKTAEEISSSSETVSAATVTVAAPSITPKANFNPFNETVLGLVWCYEKTGRLAENEYDEQGDCEGQGSIWQQKSQNQSIQSELVSFIPSATGGPSTWPGIYKGNVRFELDDQSCRFSFHLLASDEGAEVSIVKPVSCLLTGSEEQKARIARNKDYDPAKQASLGLVWCFDISGLLATQYDDSGNCEGHGSIWQDKSTNTSIQTTIKSFEADRQDTPRLSWRGTYDLLVTFTQEFPDHASNCRFEAKLIAKEENMSVYVYTPPTCD